MAQTPIETYTGQQLATMSMPGTVNEGNIDFIGLVNYTSLFFTEGSVSYGDTLIDFFGHEAEFMAANYLVTLSFPNSPGSMVTAQGTWMTQGTGGEIYSGSLTWEGVLLGASFSANSFDLVVGNTFTSLVSEVLWDSSSVIPELNGHVVSIDGIHTVTGVTPVAGAATVTASGTIYAEPKPTGVGDVPFPQRITLQQNYPNPFNPTTTIEFTLPARAPVNLSILDVRGRLLITLVDEILPGATHKVLWDGRNSSGHLVGSGIYFYRLRAGRQEVSKRMTLLQ